MGCIFRGILKFQEFVIVTSEPQRWISKENKRTPIARFSLHFLKEGQTVHSKVLKLNKFLEKENAKTQYTRTVGVLRIRKTVLLSHCSALKLLQLHNHQPCNLSLRIRVFATPKMAAHFLKRHSFKSKLVSCSPRSYILGLRKSECKGSKMFLIVTKFYLFNNNPFSKKTGLL